MVVDIIRIQVGSDYDLIVIAPHPPRGFHADGVCLLRCHLTSLKALVSVVGHIPTQLAVAALGVHHSFISQLLGAVDGTDIHFLIGLFVIGSIAQGAVQILVQEFPVGGLVRVLRIVDGIL